jgi:hypothetical protein
MKMTHLFALHGHFGGGGGVVLVLLLVALVALVFAFLPDKSQTK